ncbi:putative beta-lysine N-acetyltransferase [Desulfopila inferna]|uniref:putative beta-lysine N-acetyltransferase n=1 Tax=Desulfopila inferna TaxID=468528 RepID=UPI0019650A73|nr:putative beta-lysine N-acetyltransferase [Desulfopila inferna]MBM9603344.1 putative beta-lysine N-acetyltransferase [Desulfopila inferna]
MALDQIESFGHSLIQHGPSNDRVYLMKLDSSDLPDILAHIDELATQRGYSKIFAKIPASAGDFFRQSGYQIEAAIPNFYNGEDDGLFMARYYQAGRMVDPASEQVEKVIEKARQKAAPRKNGNSSFLECRLAAPKDCPQMSELYRQIFASYPFPIDDPQYLRCTMAENVVYAGIWQDEKLTALASAEVDRKAANAEMTDFATHPDYRGQGLATILLQKLEGLMKKDGIKTCYTIARATSYGMNITFAANGYVFAGTLINNTQISGSLESMNIWYKQI